MQLRYILLSILLITGIGLSQQKGSINSRIHALENGFNTVQKDSILALVKTTIDTILSGTATLNLGADSVIVTHGIGTAPSINNINVIPQGDIQGFDYWVEDITATTFKIKVSDRGYLPLSGSLSFSWQVFNADLAGAITLGYIKVDDYGAKGDFNDITLTGTNDRAAIESALNSSDVIYLSNKKYLIDSTLNVNGKTIISDNAELHLDPSVTQKYMLYAGEIGDGTGKSGSAYSLTADLIRGAQYCSVGSDVSHFGEGDIVIIKSTLVLFDNTDAGTCYKSEMHKIRRISGNDLIFNEPINDTYTLASDAPTVQKINTTEFNIIGKLKLIAHPSSFSDRTNGIFLKWVKDLNINVELYNITDIGINLVSCYSPYINISGNVGYYQSGGTGAALNISDFTCYGNITGGSLLGFRHAIATGSAGDGIGWENTIDGVKATSSYGSNLPVFDAHVQTGSITYKNCEAYNYNSTTQGGFVLGAKYITLLNNKVVAPQGFVLRVGKIKSLVIDGFHISGNIPSVYPIKLDNNSNVIDNVVLKNITGDYDSVLVSLLAKASLIYLNKVNIRNLVIDGVSAYNVAALNLDSALTLQENLTIKNINVGYKYNDHNVAHNWKAGIRITDINSEKINFESVDINNANESIYIKHTNPYTYKKVSLNNCRFNEVNQGVQLSGLDLSELKITNCYFDAPIDTLGVIKGNSILRNVLFDGNTVDNKKIIGGTNTVDYLALGTNILYTSPNIVPDSASRFDTGGVTYWATHDAVTSYSNNTMKFVTNGTSAYFQKTTFGTTGLIYYVSMDLRSPNSTKRVYAYLGNGNQVYSGKHLTTNWQTFTFQDTFTTARLVVYPDSTYQSAGDTVYVDNIIVKEVAPSLTYVATNFNNTLEILSGSPTDIRIARGYGSPEGIIVANTGAVYFNRNGGTSTTMYVKETNGGSTGWIAK